VQVRPERRGQFWEERLVNFLDRCGLTLPIEPPVGLMVVGHRGEDRRLLAIGSGIETVLERARKE
jgi:Asp-tRNA(Asn)/Glu-tRNA(Gln) amidotransferase A subunit family amidase